MSDREARENAGRVVVTGLGVVSPNGCGLETYAEAKRRLDAVGVSPAAID